MGPMSVVRTSASGATRSDAVKKFSLGVFCLSVWLNPAGVASALLPAAPPITPALWLNAGPGFSPDDLDGRLVLIERWATW